MKDFLSNKTGFFLYIFIIFITLNTTYTARAEVSSDSPHFSSKPIPCIGCHQETLGAYNGPGECGDCHKYMLSTGGIDVPKLQVEHNPQICKACHMGNTIANGSEKEIFHSGHSAVQCTRCHTEDNFNVIKIKNDGFRCVSCHGTQIHSIHVKNLDKACPVCHGSWAAGKTYNPESASPQSANVQEKTPFEQFTILDIIKNIFNIVLKIFGS